MAQSPGAGSTLTGICLQNFKALKDSGQIVLAPITVLVGPNSSGKSSVIQALLSARQTARMTAEGAIVLSDGEQFDLGSFREVLRRGVQPPFLTIQFAIRASTRKPRPFSVVRSFSEPHINATLTANIAHLAKARQTYVRSVSMEIPSVSGEPPRKVEGSSMSPGSERFKWHISGGVNSLGIEKIQKRRDQRFYWLPYAGDLFPSERLESPHSEPYRTALVSRYCGGELEDCLRRLRHVGAMRDEPARLYTLKGTRPGEVGRRGERAPDIILAETRRKKSRERLMHGVNDALRAMGISSQVSARIPSGASAFSLLLEHLKPRISGVNLASVGFGVSQILPILVEAFHSEPGAIIMLEQPEIHLQPRAQSRVADILVSAAMHGGRRFLVETHSEHFIRRLQVLVAQKLISSDDVHIYFFHPTEDGTTVKRIHVETDGRLAQEWPDGFFDESIALSIQHLEALSPPQRTSEGGDA